MAEEKKPKPTGAGLQKTMDNIEKLYGKGSIMRMGDSSAVEGVQVISTGSLGLDIALGVGGVPRSRVVEIFGPEGTGKTTLALQILAQAQKAGGVGAFVDAEHALDRNMARGTGVDVDELLLSQPDSGEQGLEITEALVRSGDVDVVVVDSVAALVPVAELAGNMGDSLPGLQARLMSQALRKLTSYIGKSPAVVIFINQVRMKIGVMFGNPETTTGGNALKFYASVRMDVRRVGGLKKGDEIIGNRVKVSVVKNKVSPPFRYAEFDLIFGKGIDQAAEVFDLAVDNGIVIKNGSWFNFGEQKLGQGRDNSLAFFKEHEDELADLTKRVREKISAN